MGRAVRQFKKEVSCRPATGEVLSTFFLHLALQKMATAVSVESRAQNQSFVSIEN